MTAGTADGIVLREATIADAAAISTLVSALTRRWIAPDCDEDGIARLLDSMATQRIEERLREGHRHVVAERDGRIVGVVALRLPSHLYYLFVAEKAQRRGVARALWDAVRVAADPDAPVTVNASLLAVPVYRKLGFEPAAPEQHDRGIRFVPMRWVPR
ncbi:GNAT family N-acetyltransferase [Lysobacter sp. MMG2]|uniref:GNAT family N-acetyltransferase n=1 Tax=Lysobacter sp. MMG2 TaxID=2801338 RepID=UPI001C225C5F|nr:GNAT family N-acetyltransferase [Lysobacter sp. MMG2]MBU8974879.1 GNAT family N-acetyltransferase [Lysobacter sp. MMG2]